MSHVLAATFRQSLKPGRMQNTFGNECFIDELAALAKTDPVEFRLKHLDDARGIEVLKRAAALAKWDTRLSPKPKQSGDVLVGRGVAYCKYELVRTYVAAVAEVELTMSTGAIRVTKFFIAHDCGQIINPDGLKNQIDGSTIQTISRTLMEEVKFDRSAVTTLDWASFFAHSRFGKPEEVSAAVASSPPKTVPTSQAWCSQSAAPARNSNLRYGRRSSRGRLRLLSHGGWR
jgi:nicotinate dehydrogenase subunit B